MRLKSVLGDDAYWVPPRLWAYAAVNQPDGDLSSYSDQEIAMLIGYSKDATSMLQALLQAGFLDADKRIHDWAEHNGYHAAYAERARVAAKARWEKERSKERGIGKERKGKETSIALSMLVASKEETAVPETKLPRARNLLIDAMVAVDGSDPMQATKSAFGAAAKALSEIRAVSPDVTPDEIRRRARNYHLHMRDATISPNALAKHWAQCNGAPENGQHELSLEEKNMAALARRAARL